MSKIYAPLGYVINNNGKEYYDTAIREDLLLGALSLADWPEDVIEEIENASDQELVEIFLDNGFELVEAE